MSIPASRLRVRNTKLNRIWPEKQSFCCGGVDSELQVEFEGERTGPYYPVSGPLPLNRYRAFRKGVISQRAERIRDLAQ